jgi:hypothetical protein
LCHSVPFGRLEAAGKKEMDVGIGEGLHEPPAAEPGNPLRDPVRRLRSCVDDPAVEHENPGTPGEVG